MFRFPAGMTDVMERKLSLKTKRPIVIPWESIHESFHAIFHTMFRFPAGMTDVMERKLSLKTKRPIVIP